MAVRQSRVGTVERKIHFYRANCGEDGPGQLRHYDAPSFLQEISDLDFSEEGRYLAVEEDQFHCAWPEGGRRPNRVVFSAIRRSGLPQVERGGRLNDLRLATTEGLAEKIHVVFFPDNIVGADFNFFGPRMSRLGAYLFRKTHSPVVDFDPILRQDFLAQLGRLRDIRMLRLRVNAAGAAIAQQADDSLFDAFSATMRASEADEAEIILRVTPRSHHRLADRIGRAVRQLARNRTLRESAGAFEVRGLSRETGRVEEVDLLRDYFVVGRQLIRISSRGRAVTEESAFRAIASAHDELAETLRESPSLRG